ncbi:MAG: two component, sigma54 specific, transcriptional regulator, Fis family [Candidatus Krumholzibacteriota bacterium]|nr:two component, sigma54 specific, transcriptional regulator, Fis family [Candidatus Krumholzibacteriota bacterium]
MVNRLDSTSLFLAQINQHAEVLGGLLGGAAQEPIDRDLIGRCIVSTRMLSKSVVLMELPDWQAVLDPFRSLLEVYRDKNLPWDERIADVTSAIIEKEDVLVAGAGVPSKLQEAVAAEELAALSREVRELVQCAAETVAPEHPEAAGDAAAESAETPGGRPAGEIRDAQVSDGGPGAAAVSRTGPVFVRGMVELRHHMDGIGESWSAIPPGALGSASVERDELRKRLLVVGFHAFSMERMIGAAAGPQSVPLIDTLTPLCAALEDHAAAAAAAKGRSVDLAFSGEKETNGAYRWTLRDNGENFVSDSHVDRDEYLAFYPGLREARKILGDLHSLLWVETDGAEKARFAFTVPPTLQDRCFVVWEDAGIAVLSSQLSGLIPAEEAEVGSDSHGERVDADGRWVPLLRLGQVFAEGPAEGDRIAVIGSLEKRVAFFVDGEGRLEKGSWKKDGGGSGRGMDAGLVKIGDTRVPLLEANGLLQKYMSIVGAVPEEQVSGGVDEVVSDSSHTQANREKDALAPPDNSAKRGEVDVLVVEENDALRGALAAILQEGGLSVRTAGGLGDAMDFLDRGNPSVVISDFRVPTMAAKAIADRLARDGRKTPVLVTTTHTGSNAETLVKKLGVSGYVAKPVNGEDLLGLVAECAARHSSRPLRRPTRLAI